MSRRITDGPPLSRERVLGAAVELADAGGIASLTIRSLADKLGVKPMSVYHHVANKDEILDGIVDRVFAEIEVPAAGGDWRAELRRRCGSARLALRRHSWAIGLLESRTTPGPATLRAHDAALGCLRGAGFTVPQTAHALTVLDSYVYGFAVQEASLPFDEQQSAGDVAEDIMEGFDPGAYPHLVEMAVEHITRPGYSFGDQFGFGLELILDGLAALLGSGADRARRDQ
ncbi:TetR/AcrR family transcriptional regulator [Dactylosporangium sp. NPDC000244]|uniref:TetR/AcrR family transcriptional regulator n=1 Tax=Dactylosporangium sp. NPDC000244 TaxID=3154365 RepID=UPI003334A24B